MGLSEMIGLGHMGGRGNGESRTKGVEWRSMTQGSSTESYRSSRWTFVESDS